LPSPRAASFAPCSQLSRAKPASALRGDRGAGVAFGDHGQRHLAGLVMTLRVAAIVAVDRTEQRYRLAGRHRHPDVGFVQRLAERRNRRHQQAGGEDET